MPSHAASVASDYTMPGNSFTSWVLTSALRTTYISKYVTVHCGEDVESMASGLPRPREKQVLSAGTGDFLVGLASEAPACSLCPLCPSFSSPGSLCAHVHRASP